MLLLNNFSNFKDILSNTCTVSRWFYLTLIVGKGILAGYQVLPPVKRESCEIQVRARRCDRV